MSVGTPQEVWRQTRVALGMIKISHSVFALPFALSAMLLAADGRPTLRVGIWVVVAMVTARTAAMAFNRLIDQPFDGKNPRTRDRALPAGQVSRRFVGLLIALSCVAFVVAAGQLNRLCLALSPVALFVVLGYSLTKRFTAWCHLWLGLALGITPVAGWIGVTGVVDGTLPVPLTMGIAVLFWVAGFDVIYSCQDHTFDRQEGLFSLPARWGIRKALLAAAAMHTVTVGALWFLADLAQLGGWYRAGVVVITLLLTAEHLLAWPGRGRQLQVAFFHVNSCVGLVILAAVLGELYA